MKIRRTRVTGSSQLEAEITLDRGEILRLVARHLVERGVEVTVAAAQGNQTARAIMARGTWEN